MVVATFLSNEDCCVRVAVAPDGLASEEEDSAPTISVETLAAIVIVDASDAMLSVAVGEPSDMFKH